MKIKLDEKAFMPERAFETDAGLDLRSPIYAVVPAWGSVTIDTGVHIELPKNTAGFLKSKSGLNVKHGITSEGVIDVGYTGSIAVKLYNHTENKVAHNSHLVCVIIASSKKGNRESGCPFAIVGR